VSSSWLDPARRALDAASGPVTVFFRDDDGGWANERLVTLIDRFATYGVPLDVGAIPAAVTPALAATLRRYAGVTDLGIHQHGFAHENHEPDGRPSEFGPARGPDEQFADIEAGQLRLRELFPGAIDPLFTPPWNRCTSETATCLVALGFAAVSRDDSASSFARPDLAEVVVNVDWFGRRRGVPLSRREIGERLASAIDATAPVGVMLHHARMDGGELHELDELLRLLATHPKVRNVRMARLLRPDVPR
jgi:hypothetical protein